MIDFSALYSKELAKVGTPNSNDAEEQRGDFKSAPRFYLERNGASYIRVVPYIDATGTPALLRKVVYHRVKSSWTNQSGITTEENKTILCESTQQGQKCRFCELAYQLKNAGDKQWYMHARVEDYLLLGTRLSYNPVDYTFTPEFEEDGRTVKMGAIFLSGISKQTRAFDDFLHNGIAGLPAREPALRGLQPHEIMARLFDYQQGRILEVRSAKGTPSTITAMSDTFALPSSDLNMDTDYLNAALYKPENIERTYLQFERYIADRISGGNFERETPRGGGYMGANAQYSAPQHTPHNYTQPMQVSQPPLNNAPFLRSDLMGANTSNVGVLLGGAPAPAVPAYAGGVGAGYTHPMGAGALEDDSATFIVTADDEDVFTQF